MDGSQVGTALAHDPQSGHFLPRNTEYRARKDRIAGREKRLRDEYQASPLLGIIARHLDDGERARSAVIRQRASNAAVRLLATLKRKPEAALPASLDEYLDSLGDK
jgi:hypothetical protein